MYRAQKINHGGGDDEDDDDQDIKFLTNQDGLFHVTQKCQSKYDLIM